jgi:hypothetical protein
VTRRRCHSRLSPPEALDISDGQYWCAGYRTGYNKAYSKQPTLAETSLLDDLAFRHAYRVGYSQGKTDVAEGREKNLGPWEVRQRRDGGKSTRRTQPPSPKGLAPSALAIHTSTPVFPRCQAAVGPGLSDSEAGR